MRNSEGTINDRVKKIRKTLKMTQVEFAKILGIKGGSISVIELGSPVTEPNIKLICTPSRLQDGKTVNEDWLRTGNGDMFVTPSAIDGELKLYDENQKELPSDEAELISVYRELLTPNKKILRDEARKILTTQEATMGAVGIETKENQATNKNPSKSGKALIKTTVDELLKSQEVAQEVPYDESKTEQSKEKRKKTKGQPNEAEKTIDQTSAQTPA